MRWFRTDRGRVEDALLACERELVFVLADDDAVRSDHEIGHAIRTAAAAIEADAAAVEALVADWASPFCDGWEGLRPDPAWLIPTLLGERHVSRLG